MLYQSRRCRIRTRTRARPHSPPRSRAILPSCPRHVHPQSILINYVIVAVMNTRGVSCSKLSAYPPRPLLSLPLGRQPGPPSVPQGRASSWKMTPIPELRDVTRPEASFRNMTTSPSLPLPPCRHSECMYTHIGFRV